MSEYLTLAPFVRKLGRRAELDKEDEQALLRLECKVRQIDRNGLVAREGDPGHSCSILLTGFAFSSRTSASGGRAVLALHMAGEPLDITGCAGGEATCDTRALTPIEVGEISRDALTQLAEERPRVAIALWKLTARAVSVQSEWLINVGRRDARGRLSHLICEIAVRQQALGLGAPEHHFVMPLTQEQLGDCTGLTAVHVNRVLQALRRENLISGGPREITILDWEGLKAAGDFRSDYLKLGA